MSTMMNLDAGLSDLRSQAMSSASFRGHSLRWRTAHHGEARSYQVGYCCRCGKEVCINTKPQPNGIDIGGEAVALNCKYIVSRCSVARLYGGVSA
jgi:hypothetical protein